MSDLYTRRPVDTLLKPFLAFSRFGAAGGVLLFCATFVALFLSNSNYSELYEDFWHLPVSFGIGSLSLDLSLKHFINDGLMAFFFFIVGLEIKKEFLWGQLNSISQSALPVAAAIGGMIVPALIFLALNPTGATSSGWGVPMATDIAFALGVLMLLGDRVPTSLKVILTTLAVVDDLGAIAVIAILYTGTLDMTSLIFGVSTLFLALVANRIGLRLVSIYGILGIISWLFFLKSGVQATVAGVLLAFTIPGKKKVVREKLAEKGINLMETFQQKVESNQNTRKSENRILHELESDMHFAQTPVEKLELALAPFSAFFIMPVSV